MIHNLSDVVKDDVVGRLSCRCLRGAIVAGLGVVVVVVVEVVVFVVVVSSGAE